MHSSYVYSAQFFPDVSEDRNSKLIIATACFDAKVRIWIVHVGINGDYLSQELLHELNILDRPVNQSVKNSIYTQDEIEDETLEQIMRPNKSFYPKQGANPRAPGNVSSIYDTIYPNCLTFNDQGRLYVGDSYGIISFWDITLKGGHLYADNFFKIRQKEIEGDQIN